MTTLNDKHYSNAEEIVNALEAELTLNGSAFIWGDIGIGKSSVVRQFAEKMHKKDPSFSKDVIDIRLALKGPEDIQGLPTFEISKISNAKVTKWAIPEIFDFDPNWKGIIFLDEFNLSQPSVMNACYQLIQDRIVSGHKLPEGAMIVAAGNPSDCNINATELPQALKNRFNHYYMIEDLDVWINWALTNNINENVITFLKTQKPELFLDHQRMDNQDNEFATPRSWESVSKVLSMNIDDNTKKNVVAGRIGVVAATHLFNYIEDKQKFQDPEEIYVHGKPFTASGVNEFYGCFIATINRVIQEQDKNKRTTYVSNMCNSLKSLRNREWIIFGAKLMVKNDSIDEVMNGKDLVELTTLAAGK